MDALRIVSEGVNRAKEANQFGILMVTHYTRILKYIKPDIVHVFADGHFVRPAALSWPTNSKRTATTSTCPKAPTPSPHWPESVTVGV